MKWMIWCLIRWEFFVTYLLVSLHSTGQMTYHNQCWVHCQDKVDTAMLKVQGKQSRFITLKSQQTSKQKQVGFYKLPWCPKNRTIKPTHLLIASTSVHSGGFTAQSTEAPYSSDSRRESSRSCSFLIGFI